MGGYAGFSLVELLVVVAIIVVLLAMLSPALDQAIEQAERVVCATNLKAMHVGWNGYAMDNKRQFPPHAANLAIYVKNDKKSRQIADVIVDYLSPKTFYCITTPNRPNTPGGWEDPTSNGNIIADYQIFAAWTDKGDPGAHTTRPVITNPDSFESGVAMSQSQANPNWGMISDLASDGIDLDHFYTELYTAGTDAPKPAPVIGSAAIFFNHPYSFQNSYEVQGELMPATGNGPRIVDPAEWRGLNLLKYDGSVAWRNPDKTRWQYYMGTVTYFY